MMVYPEAVHYASLSRDDIPFLVSEHFLKGRVVERFKAQERLVIDELGAQAKEVRVVLRNCRKIDPLNIEDYIAEDGYLALGQVSAMATPWARSTRSSAPGCLAGVGRAFWWARSLSWPAA